jgi:hypothetical protein
MRASHSGHEFSHERAREPADDIIHMMAHVDDVTHARAQTQPARAYCLNGQKIFTFMAVV